MAFARFLLFRDGVWALLLGDFANDTNDSKRRLSCTHVSKKIVPLHLKIKHFRI